MPMRHVGALFYGMVAPFVNYSVAGWIWYQVSGLQHIVSHSLRTHLKLFLRSGRVECGVLSQLEVDARPELWHWLLGKQQSF